jgi:hypothetical protein
MQELSLQPKPLLGHGESVKMCSFRNKSIINRNKGPLFFYLLTDYSYSGKNNNKCYLFRDEGL